jgi:hypothetical protein
VDERLDARDPELERAAAFWPAGASMSSVPTRISANPSPFASPAVATELPKYPSGNGELMSPTHVGWTLPPR